MNKPVLISFVRVMFVSLFMLGSSSVAALPLKGALGMTGEIKQIAYEEETVFFNDPGWAEVIAAEGDFLNDFDVGIAGPMGHPGSWVSFNDFGAASSAGSILWAFDKAYDGTVDIWFELSRLYSTKFDKLNGTMEVLGVGFITDGLDEVESYWSFNATQKEDVIVFSSAFSVPEPGSLLLLMLGLFAIFVNLKLNKGAITAK